MNKFIADLKAVLVDGAGVVGQKLADKKATLDSLPEKDGDPDLGAICHFINNTPIAAKDKGALLKMVLSSISAPTKSKKAIAEEIRKAKKCSKAEAGRLADKKLAVAKAMVGKVFRNIESLGGLTKVKTFTRSIHTSTRV